MKVESALDWDGDSSLYILHARNLVEGRPYSQTGYVYNPNYASLSPASYPPGYPVLLAPVYAAFGLDFRVMRLVTVVFYAASLLTFAALVAHFLPPAWAIAGVLILGLNPEFRLQGRVMGSDVPFLFIEQVGLLLALDIHRSPRDDSVSRGALLGLIAYLGYAIRTVGGILVPAFLCAEFLRRRRLGRLALASVGVFFVAAILQGILISGISTYFDQLHSTAGLVTTHAIGYARELAMIWDNGGWSGLKKLFLLLTMVFGVVGLRHVLRHGITTLEVFGLCYLGIIITWPSMQGFRFVLPLLSLGVLYALVGLETSVAKLRRRSLRAVVIAGAAASMAGTVAARHVRGAIPLETDLVQGPESKGLINFIEENTPGDALCVFLKPRVLALLTGRNVMAPDEPGPNANLLNSLRGSGTAYLILGAPWLEPWAKDRWRKYLTEFMDRHPTSFSKVFSNGDFEVYRIAQR